MLVRELQQRYDVDREQWCHVDPATVVESFHCLTLLTLNVWLDDFEKEVRTEALLRHIRSHAPDVVLLQEVTERAAELLLQDIYIKESYFITNLSAGLSSGYGNLTLSRFPFSAVSFLPLPGERRRKAVVATISYADKRVMFANVHLESKRQAAVVRAQQLPLIFSAVAGADISVVGGDFNFCSAWQDENRLIDTSYIDIWEQCRPGEAGFTEDTSRNLMRLDFKNEEKQVRFDRLLVRSSDVSLSIDSCDLLGTEPLCTDNPRLFISDHFGLLGQFSVSGA